MFCTMDVGNTPFVANTPAMLAAGEKTVTMVKERLPQNNRQGRKMLQTYFKKRGVTVEYAE